jgi:hypothetical protein
MKLAFSEHKEKLFEILQSENYHDEFLTMIQELYNQGSSKKEICDLFGHFHRAIQVDERTKNDESLYDNLSDFMDGFTAWGKKFKILPNEPDL